MTHAAITENKRLGAVLAWIKSEQDKTPSKVKTKRASARNAYVKTDERRRDARRWSTPSPRNGGRKPREADHAAGRSCDI